MALVRFVGGPFAGTVMPVADDAMAAGTGQLFRRWSYRDRSVQLHPYTLVRIPENAWTCAGVPEWTALDAEADGPLFTPDRSAAGSIA